MVGTVNMTTNNPSDAAVVNLKGTNKSLAFSVDCNSRYVKLIHKWCEIAVAEAARNITSYAKPTAVTNCLNFVTHTILKWLAICWFNSRYK